MAQVKVYGVEQTVAELRALDKNLVTELRKDLRSAVEPVKSSIRAYIPDEAPLRGMKHKGRTAWVPSSMKVSVKTSFTKRTANNESALVSIWVGATKGQNGSAGLNIADMAGLRGKTSSGKTRDYAYRNGTRRHTRNGQGRALIDYMNGRYSKASRFVWRGAIVALPAVQASVLLSLEKASKKINARLVKM
jgi:hypothetical protein